MGLYLGGKKIGNGNVPSLANEQVKSANNISITKVDKSYVGSGRYKVLTKSGNTTLKYRFSSTNVYVCDSLDSIASATKITVDDVTKFSFENAHISYYFPLADGNDNYQCVSYEENKDKFDISFSVETSNYATVTLTLLCDTAELPGYTYNPYPRFFGVIGILKYEDKYVLFNSNSVLYYSESYTTLLPENDMSYNNATLLIPALKEIEDSKLYIVSKTPVYTNGTVSFSSPTVTTLYFYTVYFGGDTASSISGGTKVSVFPNIYYEINGVAKTYSNDTTITQNTYRRLNND